MADHYTHPQFILEITVLSADNLVKKPASFRGFFSRSLRPFFSVTKFNGNNNLRADFNGGNGNFILGEKFLVPIESNFFANKYSCICLRLHTKRILGRQAEVGWCWIPASDIGAPPVGSVRHMSYKLISKDGSKGEGVVNLEVKMKSCSCLMMQSVLSGKEVIGIPVKCCHPVIKASG